MAVMVLVVGFTHYLCNQIYPHKMCDLDSDMCQLYSKEHIAIQLVNGVLQLDGFLQSKLTSTI